MRHDQRRIVNPVAATLGAMQEVAPPLLEKRRTPIALYGASAGNKILEHGRLLLVGDTTIANEADQKIVLRRTGSVPCWTRVPGLSAT